MFAFNKLKIIKISTGSIQSHGLRGKNVLKNPLKWEKEFIDLSLKKYFVLVSSISPLNAVSIDGAQ